MKIGVLFSLTGTTSITEIGQLHAAQLALEEFNQENKRTFEFVIRDIKSDPIESYMQAEQLAQSGIRIFIGTYSSACRKAVLPILEKYGCLLIYPALFEGDEAHPNVIYMGEVPNQQIYIMLKYIQKHYGLNLYLIGNDYIYPRTTNLDIRSYLKILNGSICGERYVPHGQTNFREIYKEIDSMKPNAIISTLVGTSLVHFYRAFKDLGLDSDMLPIFSPTTKETEIQEIGPAYTAGHYSSGSYFQSLDNRENIEFVSSFKKKFGSQCVVSSVMFNTYIGVSLLLETVNDLESDDPSVIMNAFKGKKINSPCGPIEIDKETCHVSRPIRIGRINDEGQFSIVSDSKELIPADPFLMKKHHSIDSLSWNELISDKEQLHSGIVLVDKQNEVLYTNQLVNDNLKVFEGQKRSPRDVSLWAKQFKIGKKEVESSPHNYQLLIIDEKNPKVLDNKDNIQRFERIKTRSHRYKEELLLAEMAAESQANVLILGETGAGKEVLAQAIHNQSSRNKGPFVAINTGAIPRELIGSELFGFVDGAFTGAKKGGQIGKFEQANHGTIFLDEIGEMPLDLQVALLRVLETRCITRLGDHRERKIDVRVIAATNRNLEEAIAYQGTFRSDLYYRLNVISLRIPPLRDCSGDLDLLVNGFISDLKMQYQEGPDDITKNALKALRGYSWPGNIRELKNCIERSFLLSMSAGDHLIRSHHLPSEFLKKRDLYSSYSLQEAEKHAIYKALKASSNISHASELLGISRSTLYRKIKEHKIDIRKFTN